MSQGTESVTRRGLLRGVAGAAGVAGASGAAAASESGSSGPVTVDVVNYAYKPGTKEPLYVKPGTTVKWVWQSSGHNIVVQSKPEGSDWKGHEPLEDKGFTYEHTFTTTGTYEYYCAPHKALGMKATLIVTENPPKKREYETIVPDSAMTLGIAATGSMASVLGLAYFLQKYGGDYGDE